jgi:hypothetical protein
MGDACGEGRRYGLFDLRRRIVALQHENVDEGANRLALTLFRTRARSVLPQVR